MTNPSPMSQLYDRLQSAGIAKAFARNRLPEWWDDSIASSNAGLQQAQLYFAKIFNLDFASLVNSETQPRFREVTHKFKMNQNIAEIEVTASAHYATVMARLAMQATSQPYVAPPEHPQSLREEILSTTSCVDLPALLAWCKTSGIPVLHIEKTPGKKMTALAIRINGRYAVVLSRKGHPSELLFYLAHELGHIANGHLSNDGFLADQKIGAGDRDDAEENEADAYAIRLLNGAAVKYGTNGRSVNATQLYQAAQATAQSERVDVGHIILNYGHTQKNFPLAKAALKLIKAPCDGNEMVNRNLFESLNSEQLSEDQLVLLRIATAYQRA